MRTHSYKSRAARGGSSDRFSVQPLEARRLLSTVYVTAYGAKANDGADDSAAFRSAISAAGDNGTVIVPAGTFNLFSEVDPIGNGRTIQGQTGAILQMNNNYAFHFRGTNVTITGLTFKGKGIFTDSYNTTVSGLVVDNNTFALDNVTGSDCMSIYFTTGLTNSRITNNTFNPIHGDTAVFGYYWNNLTIANNAFYNGNEGIHVTDFGTSSTGLLIEQNYFNGLHRMGVELQGGGVGSVVQDNYYENPSMTSNFNDNQETFAYSIVADKSKNDIIRRNTAYCPERPDGTGVRIVFELGGANLDCYDNYVVGGNAVAAVTGMYSTGKVHDNRFINPLWAPYNANGSTTSIYNNGPTTTLSWNINRPKPGPNVRIGLGLPPAAPTALTGVSKDVGQATITWADNSSDETGFSIEQLASDGVTWNSAGTAAAGATSYTIGSLTAGGTYSFRIKSFNTSGTSAASSILTIITQSPIIGGPKVVGGVLPGVVPVIGGRPVQIGSIDDRGVTSAS